MLKLNPSVLVGVRGEQAARNADDDERPIDNIALAQIHEFGLGNNPQRSFIRDTIDLNARTYARLAKRLTQAVMITGFPLVKALNVLGLKVKTDMQNAIRNGIEPGLDEKTIARRRYGGTKPLLDTGQLVGSIAYKVEKA